MFALYSDGICGTVPPKGIVPRQCGGAKAARTREGRWCSGWYGRWHEGGGVCVRRAGC